MQKKWMVLGAVLAAACGDDGGGGTSIDAAVVVDGAAVDAPEVSTITVAGTVVDLDGAPVARAAVWIRGSEPVSSDDAGNFSVAGVEVPYDAIVTIGGQRASISYVGLTRADPTIVAPLQFTTNRTARVDGTLSAGMGSTFTNPSGANVVTRVVMNVANGRLDRSFGSGVVSPYSADVTWRDTPAASGRMHAFQWTSTGGLATAFHGYGNTNVTISAGGTTSRSIVMQPVAKARVDGTAVVPSGWTLIGVTSQLRLDSSETIAFNSTTATTFAHDLPQIAGATGCVLVNTSRADGTQTAALRGNLSLPAAGLSVEAPSAVASYVSPAASATGVGPGTALRVSAVPGALYIHALVPTNDPTSAEIMIVTASADAVIPDTAALGSPIRRETAYTWQVYTITRAAASVDEAHVALGGFGRAICTIPELDLVLPESRLLIMK